MLRIQVQDEYKYVPPKDLGGCIPKDQIPRVLRTLLNNKVMWATLIRSEGGEEHFLLRFCLIPNWQLIAESSSISDEYGVYYSAEKEVNWLEELRRKPQSPTTSRYLALGITLEWPTKLPKCQGLLARQSVSFLHKRYHSLAQLSQGFLPRT